MAWACLNAAPLLNIVGIVFDIVGAILVAIEVVRPFRGMQYGDRLPFDSSVSLAPAETEEYKTWARRRSRNMRRGLFCLMFGFILQIIANAMQFKTTP
jgi:hypothetical protein